MMSMLPIQPEPASRSLSGHLLPDQLLEGRYRILGQVGTGGFGAVYKAEDTQSGNRSVAIKEIRLSGLRPEQVIEATDAFNQEVLLLSNLKHPNIPHIYAHFTDAEHWYLVMDFIEGETLEEHLQNVADTCPPDRVPLTGARMGLPVEQVLAIGIQLCTVLDYLHNQQPPIIFRDLKPANVMLTSNGSFYLIDFGVARHFKRGKAKDTIAFGSPGYAAPEQYGKAQTTAQSDIYSLGATLHNLLTGIDPAETPFRFASLQMLNEPVPAGLERLIMQMLEMDSSNRPASIGVVKRELERIAARQTGGKASKPRPKQPVSPVHPVLPFSTLGMPLFAYRSHLKAVRAVDWSPDGKQIASASEDGTVQVWEALTGDHRFTYHNHSGAVYAVAWSHDGQRIASAGADHTVHIWEATTEPLWLRSLVLRIGFKFFICEGHAAPIHAVAWSPDDQQIASASEDGRVLVWNGHTGSTIFTYQGHSDWVHSVAWSPDGKYIASASIGHSVRIWNAITGDSIFAYRSSSIVYSVSWSPSGKNIALGCSDGAVQIWDVASERKLFTYHTHAAVHAVAWSPDGKRLASGASDKTVHVWDAIWSSSAAAGKPSFIYRHHVAEVWTLAWSPDGQRIASGDDGGTVHVWQTV